MSILFFGVVLTQSLHNLKKMHRKHVEKPVLIVGGAIKHLA